MATRRTQGWSREVLDLPEQRSVAGQDEHGVRVGGVRPASGLDQVGVPLDRVEARQVHDERRARRNT